MPRCSLYLCFEYRRKWPSGFPVAAFLMNSRVGKTWHPEMGSPYRNFKISETTGSILLQFAENIVHGMVFWYVNYRDCGSQQAKFTFWVFQFLSPTILKIKFQRMFLNKAGVCGDLIAYHFWY